MRHRTKQSPGTATLRTTSGRVIGPNPLRKAILFNPLPGGLSGTAPIVAVAFTPTTDGIWLVPAGVTELIDAYVWGAGGNPGAPGAVLGGGGGGGGGFVSLGATAVTPGSPVTVVVDNAGNGGTSSISVNGGTGAASAISGTNGLLDAAGTKGTPTAGQMQRAGGNGAAATALGGSGGGGGGAGGSDAVGASAAGTAAGAGGGTATISTYGAGGNGSNGQVLNVAGIIGSSPGGGGGGSGKNGAAAAGGADGAVVIFYALPDALAGISLAPWDGVVLGQGAINFVGIPTYPVLLSDEEFGTSIGEAWHGISGVDSVVFRYVEITYDDPEIIRAF